MVAANRTGPDDSLRGYLTGAALVLALFGYSIFALLIPAGAGEEGGSAVTVVFRAVVAAVFCLAFLAGPRRKGYRIGPLWPMYVFLFLYTLRLYENFFIRNFVWTATPTVSFGLLLGAAVLPALLLPPLLPLKSPRAFALPMALASLAFIAGVAMNLEAFRSPDVFFGRAGTEKLNPISLASVATSLAIFLLLWRGRAAWMTLAQYAAVAGLLAVALLTQSRGPILATAAALALLFLFSTRENRRRLLGFLLIGVAVAAIGAASMIGELASTGFQRFHFDDDHMDDSALGRLASWSASWDQFLASPLTGDRVFEPILLRYPHNLFLESLISVGLIGTSLLVLHLVITLRAMAWILRRPASPPYAVFIALMALKELIQAQFSGAVWTNTGVWVASALTITIYAHERRAIRRARREAPQAGPTLVEASHAFRISKDVHT